MNDELQYAKRDHPALGDHYTRHVSAMTGEGLHSKSAIAAELAWRDAEITRLRASLAAPPAVPPGMVLVPIEPTEAMCQAADEADREYSMRNFGPACVRSKAAMTIGAP